MPGLPGVNYVGDALVDVATRIHSPVRCGHEEARRWLPMQRLAERRLPRLRGYPSIHLPCRPALGELAQEQRNQVACAPLHGAA